MASFRKDGRRGFTQGKLFLGGLNKATSHQSIIDYCSQWGLITDAVVMENRGFGFVTFADPLSAQHFLDMPDHIIDQKKIEAKAAVPRNLGSNTQLTKKMFVGGTGEISDDEFRQHFDRYGDIEDAAIVRSNGVSRGFGFVTFKHEVSVEKCLVEAHILPNGRKVDIKRAVPREQIPVRAPPMIPQQGMIYPPFIPYPYGYGYGMGSFAGGNITRPPHF